MTWLDRLVMNYPKVRPTNLISRSFYDKSFSEQTIIRPSLWDKTISIIIFLLLAIVWIGLLRMLLAYKFPFAVFLFGFLLVTFLIFLLIRNSFFNKKYIYTLAINKESICIDHHKVMWTDIADTFIMNRQEGRWTNYYLIILKKDKTIDKLDLFKMGTLDKKLSTIVEYYRQKANAQQEYCQ